MKNFDLIVIGAGAVGLAVTAAAAKCGIKTLLIEKEERYATGESKVAIGGIRATHSEPAKLAITKKSIEIFSTWKEKYGDELDWRQGGYIYPVYTQENEIALKNLIAEQHKYNLNNNWISAEEISQLVKGIETKNLCGGTYSPEDGTLCTLKVAEAYYRLARELGAEFKFSERALKVSVEEVITDRDKYSAKYIVVTDGYQTVEIPEIPKLPIAHELHEAGVTNEAPYISAGMVVDIEEIEGTGSFYFYQTYTGQLIFCVATLPSIITEKKSSGSKFLPLAAKRMMRLIPGAGNIKVRRCWAGHYPMTPDGVPFIDRVNNIIVAVGMCGQGLMLSAGIGYYISKMIQNDTGEMSPIFDRLSMKRVFSNKELLL